MAGSYGLTAREVDLDHGVAEVEVSAETQLDGERMDSLSKTEMVGERGDSPVYCWEGVVIRLNAGSPHEGEDGESFLVEAGAGVIFQGEIPLRGFRGTGGSGDGDCSGDRTGRWEAGFARMMAQ